MRRRASKVAAAVFVVDADTLAADARPCCAPAPSRSASTYVDLSDLVAAGLPGGRRLRRPAVLPGTSGAVRDHAAAGRRGARARARSSPSPTDLLALTLLAAARGVGADVAVGTHPALRRAAGLRRSARRRSCPCAQGWSAACPAGSSACRVDADGDARPTGSRCRPASSTSAGRRRRATSARRRCCSPSWPAMYAVYHGPEGLAAIAERVHRLRRRCSPTGCAPAASRSSHDAVLRHGAPSRVAGPGRRGRRRGPRARDQPAPRRRRHASAIACDETTTRAPRRGGVAAFGVTADLDALDERRVDALPGPGCCATIGVPHAPGLPRAPLARPRCCATCARCRDKDLALDRDDDPARLVHDEAQRDRRDGADHLAGVRRASTRSRPLEQARGLPRELIAELERLAGRDHRLRRGVAAAQRRLARASSPGCSRSARYHRGPRRRASATSA